MASQTKRKGAPDPYAAPAGARSKLLKAREVALKEVQALQTERAKLATRLDERAGVLEEAERELRSFEMRYPETVEA